MSRIIPDADRKQVVANYVAGASMARAGVTMGIGSTSVQRILRAAGVKGRSIAALSEEDQMKIAQEYESGMSRAELVAKYGLHSKEPLRTAMRKHGIAPHDSGGKRKWSFDQDFFRSQTPESAYWAGFIMADGSLCKQGRTWELVLRIDVKDVEHIRRYCAALRLDQSAIRTVERPGSVSVGVNICHKRLAEDLLPWGIVKRKSYDYSIPSVAPRLLPDYLRGWFDGDGHIRAGRKGTSLQLVGNRDAVQWYLRALRSLGYEGGALYRHTPGKAWARLLINGKASVAEASRILQASPGPLRLERKWLKLDSLWTLEQMRITS